MKSELIDMTHANAALFAALAKAQHEVESADKDSTNQHARYKYTSNEEMTRVARGPMGRHGLSILTPAWDVEPPTRPDCLGVLIQPWVLTHSDGGYIIGQAMMDIIESKRNKSDKQMAAALSYLKTYILKGILNMDRMEDAANTVDGRDESQMGGRRQQQPQQQRQQRTPPVIVDAKRLRLRREMQAAASDLLELGRELGVQADPAKVAGDAVHPGEPWDREREYNYADYERGTMAIRDMCTELQDMSDADEALGEEGANA